MIESINNVSFSWKSNIKTENAFCLRALIYVHVYVCQCIHVVIRALAISKFSFINVFNRLCELHYWLNGKISKLVNLILEVFYFCTMDFPLILWHLTSQNIYLYSLMNWNIILVLPLSERLKMNQSVFSIRFQNYLIGIIRKSLKGNIRF